MSTQEFFIETISHEIPIFERVLSAFPTGSLDSRHHDSNKSAHEIISLIASDALCLAPILKRGFVDFQNYDKLKQKSISEAIETLKNSLNSSIDYIKEMPEEQWDSDAAMNYGDKEIWRTTRGKMAWGTFFDMVHHRGQLSTYIRPMGGKVPNIYGPSGDSEQ